MLSISLVPPTLAAASSSASPVYPGTTGVKLTGSTSARSSC